ncbi:MAG: T9SS type A sorting domain-containing protein [Cytophagaceae bacterium]|jgi:hypothetical protein|nr:T9SS type A sorting domain-containing protein [Cytophagaceae bacterium]
MRVGILQLIVVGLFLISGNSFSQTSSTWFRSVDSIEYVDIGDLDIPGNQLTVEALVYRTASGADIVSKHCSPANANYLLRLGSASITTTDGFFLANGCTGAALNVFYHVALTYNGSELRFYINGGLVGSTPATGNLFQNDFSTKIGFIGCLDVTDKTFVANVEQWRGYIDEVRIWNIARPQDSLMKYKRTSLPNPTTQAGLQAYYRFNSLTNLQGNPAWNGTLMGTATIGNTMTLPASLPPFSCSSYCSPGKIPSMLTWYKANQGVSGSPVSIWNDQSGNYNNLNSSPPNRPVVQTGNINYNPAIRFDGTDDRMLHAGGIFNADTYSDVNAYFVSNTHTVKNQSIFWETSANTNGRFNSHLPWGTGVLAYDVGDGLGIGRVSQAWGGTGGTYYLWGMNSTTGGTSPSGERQAIYRNGLMISIGTDRTDSESLIGNNSTFTLGAMNNGSLSSYFDGDIAEFAVFNESLTNTEHMRIQSYLALKYGISLDQSTLQNYVASNGTTVVYPATTTHSGFIDDIAGIGRDDGSCLNQRQSKSINADDIMAIGLNAIAATNDANTGAFSNDLSFLVWGNNNLSLSAGPADFGTSVNGDNIQARLHRVWRAAETGTVGTVRIQVNLSSVPGNADLSFTRLLTDADGVFASGATSFSPVSFNNTTKIAEFDVNFTAGTGFYFTIGTVNAASTPLPVSLLWMNASSESRGNRIEALLNASATSATIQIERSYDANQWEVVYQKPVNDQVNVQEISFIDERVLGGITYYRLVAASASGDREIMAMANVHHQQSSAPGVFPNPNQGDFTLTNLPSQASRYVISDLQGMKVAENTIQGDESPTVQVNHLSAGIYYMTIYSETKQWVVPIIIR